MGGESQRYCLALDLKNEQAAINAYKKYHEEVWPEVIESIEQSGITDMQIYHTGNRLFMIMETGPNFSFEAKARADASNAIVQRWEALMDQYQQVLPNTEPGQKWQLMEKLFSLRK